MAMKALRLSFVLAALAVLAGCPAQSTSGTSSTYTISGTIAATWWGINTPATVTITQGSLTFSATATVPAHDVNGLQSATYSVSGVPAGTYSVSITATDTYTCGSGFATNFPNYTIGIGSPVTVDSATNTTGSSPYSMTITVNSLTISGSETINFNLGTSNGC